MESKLKLMMYARSIANSYVGVQADGKVRDWELLKDIYDVAMQSPPNWTAEGADGNNLTAIQSGKWLRKDGKPGGTKIAAEGIAWCGIFATYCMRGIGINAKWKANYGIYPREGIVELCSYAKSNEIEIGDICVKGTNQHHFIVHKHEANILHSYDGNLDGQNIAERTYNITDMKNEAIKADKEVAQKMKDKTYVPGSSKYNFYFYRLLV